MMRGLEQIPYEEMLRPGTVKPEEDWEGILSKLMSV